MPVFDVHESGVASWRVQPKSSPCLGSMLHDVSLWPAALSGPLALELRFARLLQRVDVGGVCLCVFQADLCSPKQKSSGKQVTTWVQSKSSLEVSPVLRFKLISIAKCSTAKVRVRQATSLCDVLHGRAVCILYHFPLGLGVLKPRPCCYAKEFLAVVSPPWPGGRSPETWASRSRLRQ